MQSAASLKRKRARSKDETSPESEGSSIENDSGRAQGCRRSSRERSGVARYEPTGVLGKRVSQDRLPTRFHITPMNEWEWLLRKMNCCVRNRLGWRNGTDLPPAPAHPCWLLPCKDDTAVEIAKHQKELRALGWKLLTCAPHVVSRIGQKANLHAYAKTLGLLQHLPQHYSRPETATFPCMLKAAVGEHGKDVFIVRSAAEVHKLATGGFPGTAAGGSPRWLLQEIAIGRNEYATSLLVNNGEILDAVTTSYEYDAEVYVWPDVEELQHKRHSHSNVPAEHLATMKSFLTDFSGICNFNYKVRQSDGGMCIFEVNARVGADLACDVPRRRAAKLFAKLDELQK